jgi:hypothetical protein
VALQALTQNQPNPNVTHCFFYILQSTSDWADSQVVPMGERRGAFGHENESLEPPPALTRALACRAGAASSQGNQIFVTLRKGANLPKTYECRSAVNVLACLRVDRRLRGDAPPPAPAPPPILSKHTAG